MPWIHESLYQPYRFCTAATPQSSASDTVDPSRNPPDKFYGVPMPNKAFVDRPAILESMETTLASGSPSDECVTLALCGLGGMGKTQLMIRYCYLHRAKYDSIIWLGGDSRTAAFDAFLKLAIELGFSEETDKDNSEKAVTWVRLWLEKQKDWLLLLDNVDDLDILEFLPRFGGKIILTTRNFIPSANATTVHVHKMSEEESLCLFLGPSLNNLEWKSDRYVQACEIVVELDHMPLAIRLARAYVDNTRTSFKDYLAQVKKKRGDLFKHRD